MIASTTKYQTDLLDTAAPNERAGFRLHRLELLNWGTFDSSVWHLHAGGDTSLLTGDIGSGKSTVVDALTTLLVSPQKVSYNKAAGAEARERTVRSYVLGHYKAERSETGTGAKPVSLRDTHSYSVLLAHFFNEGYGQHVTLAQVFWMKEQEGQPARLCLVADKQLTIAEHFSNFADIAALKRRLREVTKEIYDTFPPYQVAFRKRFGIQNEQALELFHQTVSMKSVGNLTDFVRQHMLQPFPVEERIGNLIRHVDDLTRAHEAILKAKEQLRRLAPLVEDCNQHDVISAKVSEERACREALRPYFASLKVDLLRQGIAVCDAQHKDVHFDVTQKEQRKAELNAERDGLKQDIARNGGERMERIRAEVSLRLREKNERQRRAESYDRQASEVNLPSALDGQTFLSNARQVEAIRPRVEGRIAELRQQSIEAGIHLKTLREQQRDLSNEVESLRQRPSNIPAAFLKLRTQLCDSLGIHEDDLPFAGELIQVHQDEQLWEGAIERVLRAFGTSLLVREEHYAEVAQWVDKTHLGARLVYYRVKEGKQLRTPATEPGSLVRKLEFKHDSPFAAWLEGEVTRRFNFACCASLEEFRREQHALTRAGQAKGGTQHTKDDRSRVDDRTRYVLGWSNHEKLSALTVELRAVENQAQQVAEAIVGVSAEEERLKQQLAALATLALQARFEEIDWRSSVAAIEQLESDLRALKSSSDVLHTLERQLKALEADLRACEEQLRGARDQESRVDERRKALARQLSGSASVVGTTSSEERIRFPRLQDLLTESGSEELSVENCVAVEQDFRTWLQTRIDAEESRRTRLGQRIVTAMTDYRNAYPVETREADASIEAAGEYRRMLDTLRNDDLPRFERHFKELLNENTIREVANFQSQLRRERQEILERIDTINKSLHEIEFNAGRFIRLEAANANDGEVRDFQQDLKACTEGALTASGDETYSESKFLQVKKIIERFRGREGSSDIDRKWTRKVTDVRNWFSFSASERWIEGDREHEHYTDSGGKSGGQKEKLAYTVLAASLAYQFGLEWGATRSRSFRFVVIDEAFGRGSDDSASYGLELFQKLNLQLLVVTPLQKIHVIEPFVANVGFVSNVDGQNSKLRNLTIQQYLEEKARRGA